MRAFTYAQMLLLVSLLLGFPAVSQGQGEVKRAKSRWGANYFPNVPLIDQNGKTVRFFDDLIKDKVVVINFIYTSCPDACPLETSRLVEVQRILGDRVGKDVFIYSITIDPDVDTPQVMKEYAETYQAGPGWSFLTGTSENITLIRRKLGLYIEEIQDGSNNHNISLMIGNQATGRWMKRSPFENPYLLATQIGSWLHNWKLPAPDALDYDEAPELRNISKGESMYRTRCAVCHSIGSMDLMQRIGPNLQGVTERRDRAWLKRWIKEPDVMLEEKDPIALGLYLAFNKVPMPNMRLTDDEVDLLLEYIEKESARVSAVESKYGPKAKGKDEAACCEKRENLVLESDQSDAAELQAPQPARKLRLSMVSILSIVAGCALGSILIIKNRRQV